MLSTKRKNMLFKLGVCSLFAAVFSMIAVFATSFDDVFFTLFFVSLILAILLMSLSGKLVYRGAAPKNLYDINSFNYSDPAFRYHNRHRS